MRGVKDKWHVPLTTLLDESLHGRWIVRTDDDGVDLGRAVVEPKHARPPHGPAVVAGQLIVVHVGGREACRAELTVEQPQPSAVDALSSQPVSILSGVGARGREHSGRVAEKREVVGVVAGDAAPALLEVVDQEAEGQDMRLVEEVVVLEPPRVGEEVFVLERIRAEDIRTVRVRKLAEMKRAPCWAPLVSKPG